MNYNKHGKKDPRCRLNIESNVDADNGVWSLVDSAGRVCRRSSNVNQGIYVSDGLVGLNRHPSEVRMQVQ